MNFIFDEKYPGGLKLFYKMPKGTEVQVALSNKNLIPMFEKMVFERIKNVEYWENFSNTTNFKGII
jgi:hypothetical protein